MYGADGPRPAQSHAAPGGYGGMDFGSFHDHYTAAQAERLFESVFGNFPFGRFASRGQMFADFDDDPFLSLHRTFSRDMGSLRMGEPFGGLTRRTRTEAPHMMRQSFLDPFDDDLNRMHFGSSSGSRGGNLGRSQSISQSVTVVNGKKTMRTETTVRNADGTVSTSVNEVEYDRNGNVIGQRAGMPSNQLTGQRRSQWSFSNF